MKRKKLKGMTLMEIIIAMAVLIIIAGILVQSAVVVVNNVRISKTVVQTVNEQAPDVENQDVASAYLAGDTISLTGAGLRSATLTVDKYQASGSIAADQQRSGNMKYFVPASKKRGEL